MSKAKLKYIRLNCGIDMKYMWSYIPRELQRLGRVWRVESETLSSHGFPDTQYFATLEEAHDWAFRNETEKRYDAPWE